MRSAPGSFERHVPKPPDGHSYPTAVYPACRSTSQRTSSPTHGFVWNLQAAMAHAAPTQLVTIELTESLMMQNSSAFLEQLHAIRGLGVHIAIDDFGTGYSSLAYLERFPVTHLKIDRSFVTPLDDPRRRDGVVHAIVEMDARSA